jgi:glycosyltransferase involved in cell wall biosynthesis/adenylate kinase family enzyme
MKNKAQLFVLGMHRSGTSMITRLINLSGAYFGSFEDSTGKNIENPKGFWERKDIREINDRILHSNGLDWDDVWGSIETLPEARTEKVVSDAAEQLCRNMGEQAPVWVAKEPRFCLTLPVWKQYCQEMAVIHIFRHPMEVAKSLRTRNGFPISLGLALWEYYVVSAITFSKGVPSFSIFHRDLYSRPNEVLSELIVNLNDCLQVNLQRPDEREVSSFIDTKLHREKLNVDEQVFLTEDLAWKWELLQNAPESAVEESRFLNLSSASAEELQGYQRFRAFVQKRERKEGYLLDVERISTLEDKRTAHFLGELASARNDFCKEVRYLKDTIERERKSALQLSEKLGNLKTDLNAKGKECAQLSKSLMKEEKQILHLEHRLLETERERSRSEERAHLALSQERKRVEELESSLGEHRAEREQLLDQLSGEREKRIDFEGRLRARDMDWESTSEQLNRFVDRVKALLKEPLLDKKKKSSYKSSSEFFEQKLNELGSSNLLNNGLQQRFNKNEEQIKKYLKIYHLTNKPLFTVVMPTYNRGMILGKSIQSVLSQTYKNFELIICDDGSSDDTKDLLKKIDDPRVKCIFQNNQGAASARNKCLCASSGDYIAYLDSDNFWHPHFLEIAAISLSNHQGISSLYSSYVDLRISAKGGSCLTFKDSLNFSHERLLDKPYIDLNSFVHRRELFDIYGGFDERLSRRQDYDLILKYTWLRDPLYVDLLLVLYQRNENFEQITRVKKYDEEPLSIISTKIEEYFKNGVLGKRSDKINKVSVLVWDCCRNHFSKAFAVAEALSRDYVVELVAFDFFDEGVFAPLKDEKPDFTVKYFKGGNFPGFFEKLNAVLQEIVGDVVYVVKPRLPSFGLAMLLQCTRGIPFILEVNDLETVVNSPKVGDQHESISLEEVSFSDSGLLGPYSKLWSRILDPISRKLPFVVSHNQGLCAHYSEKALYLRNVKDQNIYNPDKYDRKSLRSKFGFSEDDRVILFGGLVRKHKGVFELVNLLEKLNDKRFKLVFVGSRSTPDQKRLETEFGEQVIVLPPQDRKGMAEVNLVADLVILWLNPAVPASHYQFPYKATDAFAMNTPVIASEVSDFKILEFQGYLRVVPFGNWEMMCTEINDVFENRIRTKNQIDAARRLYLRQFSYNSVRSLFPLMVKRAFGGFEQSRKVSEEFSLWYDQFQKSFQLVDNDNTGSLCLSPICNDNSLGFPFNRIFTTGDDGSSLSLGRKKLESKILVIICSEDENEAVKTAKIILKRASFDSINVLITNRSSISGFDELVSFVVSFRNTDWFLFVSDHAFPSRDWLRTAFKTKFDKATNCLLLNPATVCAEYSKDSLEGRVNLIHRSLIHSYVSQNKSFSMENFRVFLRETQTTSCNQPFVNINELHEYSPRSNQLFKTIDIKTISSLDMVFESEICVVMPCIDIAAGTRTMGFLESRAGRHADFVLAVDSEREGFINVINKVSNFTRPPMSE